MSTVTFDKLMMKAIHLKSERKCLKQVRRNKNRAGESDFKHIEMYFSNDLRTRRVVTENGENSRPYGYQA